MHVCTHAWDLGHTRRVVSGSLLSARTQAHSLHFSPGLGCVHLLMSNVHSNLGYLMGMELAKGGWWFKLQKSCFPSSGLSSTHHMSCVPVVAFNVGARGPTRFSCLGNRYSPTELSHLSSSGVVFENCSCRLSGLIPCKFVSGLPGCHLQSILEHTSSLTSCFYKPSLPVFCQFVSECH